MPKATMYVEKQFCAPMIATHHVENRIAHKAASMMAFPEAARKVPLAWLTAY